MIRLGLSYNNDNIIVCQIRLCEWVSLTGNERVITIETMNETQELIEQLMERGWTMAAISDAISTHRDTVVAWRTGRNEPANVVMVVGALRGLLRRSRVPKKRRYS